MRLRPVVLNLFWLSAPSKQTKDCGHSPFNLRIESSHRTKSLSGVKFELKSTFGIDGNCLKRHNGMPLKINLHDKPGAQPRFLYQGKAREQYYRFLHRAGQRYFELLALIGSPQLQGLLHGFSDFFTCFFSFSSTTSEKSFIPYKPSAAVQALKVCPVRPRVLSSWGIPSIIQGGP